MKIAKKLQSKSWQNVVENDDVLIGNMAVANDGVLMWWLTQMLTVDNMTSENWIK